MTKLSKLGIILTSLFSFLLLALLAEILYLVWRRRNQKQTRVEPAGSGPRDPGTMSNFSDSDGLKLDGLYGPTSRVLFTIKEEEAEKEEFENGELNSKEVVSIMVVGCSSDYEVEEPPFLTPCGSPPYYTPSSSPSRDCRK